MNENEKETQDMLHFSKELLSLYFEKRDMEALADYIVERTSWIGTGKDELCTNSEEAKIALEKELLEYGDCFQVVNTDFHFTPFSTGGGIVYGNMRAIPNDDTLSEENVRISAVFEQIKQQLKLIHLHFSHADLIQEEGHYFVKQSARFNNENLRTILSAREQQLANLTKNIPGGAHQCANDPSMTLLSMSDGFLSMFGYTKEEIETQFEGKFINMIYPGDRAEMIRSTYAQLEKGPNLELEYRVLKKSGQPLWVLDKGRLMDDGNGGQCFYCILLDTTERKRQQEELRLSLERHKVITDQTTDIIFEWDILKDTLIFSPNWKKRFGYDAISTHISDTIPQSKNIHPDDMDIFIKIMKDTIAGIPYSESEFRISDSEGNYSWSRIRATTQYNVDKCPIKAVGVIVDIDEEKKQKEELIQRAQYDELTGIYNKATVSTLVHQKMHKKHHSINDSSNYHALLIIDIDHFKTVNDTYGHLCGDYVLSNVAAVLKENTRSTDLVGRIGGDEFLVYLPEIADEISLHHKATQLIESLSCIQPDSNAEPITCSIGIAIFKQCENDFEALYKNADTALYKRKNAGRNGFTFYKSQMNEKTPDILLRPTTSPIISNKGNVVDEWLAQYAFRALYKATDIETTLNKLLKIIGNSFDVSRVYIFESSKDGTTCSNTFEWCSEGIYPQIDTLQNIAYVDDLGDYLKNFDENGIFHCHNIKNLHPDVYGILKPQGIYSMLQCAILDEGKFIGYVGFDECRKNIQWNDRQIATFQLVANVLSIFLIKLRQKQELNQTTNND